MEEMGIEGLSKYYQKDREWNGKALKAAKLVHENLECLLAKAV